MATDGIRIRAYRVGLGDCLLISLPGSQHMLVDCGCLGEGDHGRLRRVAEDVARETHNHVNVVVASHRHADHINGFAAHEDIWNRIEVDEVWLPWTENPQQVEAATLRRQQDGIARALARSGSGLGARLAANSITNEAALDVLLDGFSGRTRRLFLSARDADMYSQALTGVHIQVIGPPQSDESLRRLTMECSLAALGVQAAEEARGPFARQLQLRAGDAQKLFRPELAHSELPEESNGGGRELVGFWLDKAINNTSLLLLLRYGETRLLLPGDAEGEAWLPFHERPELREDLAALDFWKLAHHGSHNGTPLRVLRAAGRTRFLASTQEGVWPEIPHGPLLRELGKRGSVMRSDRPGRRRGYRQGPFWLDLELKS